MAAHRRPQAGLACKGLLIYVKLLFQLVIIGPQWHAHTYTLYIHTMRAQHPPPIESMDNTHYYVPCVIPTRIANISIELETARLQ